MHDRSEVETKEDNRSKLSPEVALLQDVFPTVSPEALMNALSVSDNNVETAKQVQTYFGVNKPLHQRLHQRFGPVAAAMAGLCQLWKFMQTPLSSTMLLDAQCQSCP